MKEASLQLQGIILGNKQLKFRTIKCEVSSFVGNPIISYIQLLILQLEDIFREYCKIFKDDQQFTT